MARDFLSAVLPYEPDAIAGDFNNLATRATCKGGDVRLRNSLFTLYLEEMLLAYNRNTSEQNQVRYYCINNSDKKTLEHARLPREVKSGTSDLDCCCICIYMSESELKTRKTTNGENILEQSHRSVA